ncbi:MAG TPA: cupin domain-containing protein [Candidatus Sulfopaludibacter sp.]|jgi:quercetin dioxygenase-like cupin family protein|nr:cupin domain-containing protein [Candidatus Sulfopaludibacter sp.]
MQIWHRLLTLGCAAAACLLAQNAPGIDNDQARVVVAHDQPHKKGTPHQHKVNRVMVYLQAGKQEFTMEDGKKTVLSWKAGDVKWSPAGGIHTPEIVSDAPVTMVEIEVKKPGDPAKKITTPLDPVKVDAKDYKVLFENSQVRVVRVKFAPNSGAPMHEHQLNRVVVYLTDQNTKLTTPDGKVETATHKAGEYSWGGPTKHKEDNLMTGPFEAIMVEFKN